MFIFTSLIDAHVQTNHTCTRVRENSVFKFSFYFSTIYKIITVKYDDYVSYKGKKLYSFNKRKIDFCTFTCAENTFHSVFSRITYVSKINFRIAGKTACTFYQ